MSLCNRDLNFKIGEYFGHGLAFVDVNGDAMDDLIIGSPLYTDDEYKQPEIGRIYVYYQQRGTTYYIGLQQCVLYFCDD